MHRHTRAMLVRSQLRGVSQHRGKAGEIAKQIVAATKEFRSFMSAISGSKKYANSTLRDERDIGVVASPAAGLLHDRGWILGLVDAYPSQADAGGSTRAGEALGPAKLRNLNVRRGGGWILVHWDARQTEKVFEPTRHIVRGRIHTSRGCGRSRVSASALIPGSDEEASTLAGGRGHRRIPQAKRFRDALGKELRVGLAGGGGQAVPEQIEPNVGIMCGGAGRKAQAIARKPLPAKAVIGKREMAAIALGIGDFAREAGGVRGQVEQGDGAAALATHREHGNANVGGSELLQRIGEGHAPIRNQLHQQVRRHNLGQRAKTDERVSIGLLMGARIGLAITLHPRLIVADKHDYHSCGPAMAE